MKNISVIGAGTMGNGIAHVFAQNGFKVSIVDVSLTQLDRAIANISKNFDRQIAKGTTTEEQKKIALANISIFSKINDGVKDADLVVEAATENIELKLKIFEEVDKFAPKQAILASNTSSISITKIANATGRADKVIGLHFMNPVPVMKLVEVINGYSTSKEVTDRIVELSKQLGKTPCVVNDYPGFYCQSHFTTNDKRSNL
jgi:3-hydroxybutyryl-CoA dehydrogenase